MSRAGSRRVTRWSGVVVVLALCVLSACSRKGAIETDRAAEDTTTVSTSTSTTSTTSTLPSDASVPTGDPNASSTTTTADDGSAFGHTADELATFRAVYSQAFEGECRRIWTIAGASGVLADPDFPEDTYTVDDCLSELDADNGEFADSVQEAQTTGVDDAQIAASDLADPLCATGGAPCFSYGDS